MPLATLLQMSQAMIETPELFHNVTVELLKELRKRGQSDSFVTIVVGVVVGIVLMSVIVTAATLCSKSIILLASTTRKEDDNSKKEPSVSTTHSCDVSTDDSTDEQHTEPSLTGIVPRVTTEGGYRSSSESSDEGEGRIVTKAAQKRARHKNGL